MKIKLLVFILLISTLNLALAKDDGGHGGNGGGGLYREGRYLTFGSAKVEVRPKPLEEIEGLNLLLDRIQILSLDEGTKGAMIEALMPTAYRQYYEIQKSDLSERQRTELINIYKEVSGISNDIAIFAVTNISAKETYFLPEFKDLNTIEKAAILFHESAWLVNSSLSYKEVVELEIGMQNYLEKNQESEKNYDFDLFQLIGKLFQNPQIPIFAAFREDYRMGRFQEMISHETKTPISTATKANSKKGSKTKSSTVDDNIKPQCISLDILFGDLSSVTFLSGGWGSPIKSNTLQIAKTHFLKMIKKYPNSLSFKAMMQNLEYLYVRIYGEPCVEPWKFMPLNSEFNYGSSYIKFVEQANWRPL